ncbi:MAG TPA: hypothetical protein VFI25_04320 [Planctomycetota bacterium]|jgi:biotin carboxyl carrier protein|nr:hypothetical protein [Planctomycetota bacterium]
MSGARGLQGTAAILAAAVLLGSGACRRANEEDERGATSAPSARISRSGDDAVVLLDRATEERLALRTERLEAATLEPSIASYGWLEADPALGFVLRAPAPGLVRALPGRSWPGLGERLADGTAVCALEARLLPPERADLSARLAAARAERDAAAATLAAARAAHERARSLNAQDKSISDRAVEEAEARVKSEEARLRGAEEAARGVEAALGSASASPLVVDRGGEVVEVGARPGESVEAGQMLLRIERFDRMLARVQVPVGRTLSPPPPTARISAVGLEERPLRGEWTAFAPGDRLAAGQVLLFRLETAGLSLRPGTAVVARLPLPGPARRGVVVPWAAVVRSDGRAWAYVRTAEARFTRREVALDAPVEEGWFVESTLAPGDAAVVSGAQALLSEEARARYRTREF